MKRGNLSLTDLFIGSPASRYWYTRGVNYRAVVCVLLALMPCLPSFAAQIAPDRLGFGVNSTAYNFFYISFTFTYFLACSLYYLSYLIFPEKGEKIVEHSLKFEQWADENDAFEEATLTMGTAEDGQSQTSQNGSQTNEKDLPAVKVVEQ